MHKASEASDDSIHTISALYSSKFQEYKSRAIALVSKHLNVKVVDLVHMKMHFGLKSSELVFDLLSQPINAGVLLNDFVEFLSKSPESYHKFAAALPLFTNNNPKFVLLNGVYYMLESRSSDQVVPVSSNNNNNNNNKVITASHFSPFQYKNLRSCDSVLEMGRRFDTKIKRLLVAFDPDCFRPLVKTLDKTLTTRSRGDFLLRGVSDVCYMSDCKDVILEFKLSSANTSNLSSINPGWILQCLQYNFLYESDVYLVICSENKVSRIFSFENCIANRNWLIDFFNSVDTAEDKLDLASLKDYIYYNSNIKECGEHVLISSLFKSIVNSVLKQ